ncbi:MAG: hypothetical protein NTW14_02645 [bacterium]|nr:hypothetical protein [bacterium]
MTKPSYILMLLLAANLSIAQIHISGPQTGVLVDTTYLVTGNISVPPGGALTIQPGARFYFNGHYAFDVEVDACLTALGTESDSIQFLPRLGFDYWWGIDLNQGSSDATAFSYCYIGFSHSSGLDCNHVSPTVNHSTFYQNWNGFSGGGINLQYSNARISDCVFIQNSCYDWGAGLCGRYSSPEIGNCIFDGNYGHATGSGGIGGGLWFLYVGNPIIRNCMIINNMTNENTVAAGIACEGSVLAAIENCTIMYNRRQHPQGSGIRPSAVFVSNPATQITNCIVRNNWGPQITGGQVTYSNVQGGYAGVGNIDSDPLFVAGPGSHFYLSQIAAGQSVNSPCIDAGNPASAMVFGSTRTDLIQDEGIVDMGYHYPVAGSWPMVAGDEQENMSLQPTTSGLSISPNPFNPTTTLTFTLPRTAKVSLEVFDVNGRVVRAHGMRPMVGGGGSEGARRAPLQTWYDAGTHTITFDGSDLPSGLYFARLRAGDYTDVQKLILLK